MNIIELLKEVFDGIERTVDTDSVIGNALIYNDYKVIPISRMSVGFGSGGGELEGKNQHRTKDAPLGALGGGATITPIGFLVMMSDEVRFIKISGEEGVTECLEKLLENIFH